MKIRWKPICIGGEVKPDDFCAYLLGVSVGRVYGQYQARMTRHFPNGSRAQPSLNGLPTIETSLLLRSPHFCRRLTIERWNRFAARVVHRLMEDKPFKEVTIMTRQLGKMKVITSIMQAAEFIVNEWPGSDTERLDIAKHALLECYDGKLSPGVARMAFIEVAKEADIYIEAAGRPVSTGRLEKWRKGRMRRRA